MVKKFRLLGLAAALVLAIMLAACGDDSEDGGAATDDSDETAEDNSGDDASDDGIELGGKDITIPYVAWAGSTTRTPILANVLEDVGYNVDTKQVEGGPMWTSTADSEDTFNATGWIPTTHEDYIDKYEDDTEIYDTNLVDKAPLALTVPEYMDDVNSIEDLKGNDELGEAVDWTIVGIDPGAGIMSSTEEAIDHYDLDNWELQESSESAMLSELQSKVEDEEPVVVPLWKPHWIFADLDLKMLDDPDDIYGGDGDHINLVFNKDFEEAHPAAYEIATRFAEDWDSEIENEYMEPIFVDDEDAEDVADQFMDENEDLVDDWEEGIAAE